MTFPVLDVLKEKFPSAEISFLIGPKAESLVKNNPVFNRLFIFDKHQPFFRTVGMIRELRKERFDLVVDLRNSAIPVLISSQFRTSVFATPSAQFHMKDKHLNRLRAVVSFDHFPIKKWGIFMSRQDEEHVRQIKRELEEGGRLIIMAPGAADHAKRWPSEYFAELADRLIKHQKVSVVFVGDQKDRDIAQEVIQRMRFPAVNLCGRLTLVQLAGLFKDCFLAIVNDSAPMHLASYLNVPVLALFGPSDPLKYGPWSLKSMFLRSKAACPKCLQPHSRAAHTCLKNLTVDVVFNSFELTPQEVVFKK